MVIFFETPLMEADNLKKNPVPMMGCTYRLSCQIWLLCNKRCELTFRVKGKNCPCTSHHAWRCGQLQKTCPAIDLRAKYDSSNWSSMSITNFRPLGILPSGGFSKLNRFNNNSNDDNNNNRISIAPYGCNFRGYRLTKFR